MSFTITTWNINSVRLRIDLVTLFLKMYEPDVLCLQETKCPNDLFPFGAFKKIGYDHIAIAGQKGYNGVAIISRHPLGAFDKRTMCGKDDARHVSAVMGDGANTASGKAAAGLTIHNVYVPAGGDIADPALNVKFEHKLAFLAEMEAMAQTGLATRRVEVVVGDLNVAPLAHDVWSHKQLLDVVSHTPIETETLERIRVTGAYVDAARHLTPEPEKLYSWWSYRAAEWESANKGRRLDHIWTSADLESAIRKVDFFKTARGWEKPSDHVPVTLTLDL